MIIRTLFAESNHASTIHFVQVSRNVVLTNKRGLVNNLLTNLSLAQVQQFSIYSN